MIAKGGLAIRQSLIVTFLALVGCEPRIALGMPCVFTSECSAPYACVAGRCRTECITARDCPYPLECLAIDDVVAGCRLDTEGSCTGSSDCPSPLVCEGGVCRQSCGVSEDCAPGLACNALACTTPEPILGTGVCDPTAIETGCGGSERCALGAGTFGCVTPPASADFGAPCTGEVCGDGQACAGGRCVRVCRVPDAPGCTGSECDGTSCGAGSYCAPDAIGVESGALPPTLPEGLGYCSERCNPYGDDATDGCPTGTACSLTVLAGEQFYLWCRPLQGPFLTPYEACVVHEWDCPLGTVCEVVATFPRLCREFCEPGSSTCMGGRPCVLVDALGIGVCGGA
jgi:hypothetical protein